MKKLVTLSPVPSRLSRGTGRDGTGRDGFFSKDHGIAATLVTPRILFLTIIDISIIQVFAVTLLYTFSS